MKKFFRFAVFAMMLAPVALTSCDDDDDKGGDGNGVSVSRAEEVVVTTQYVNAVVEPIYKDLKEKNQALYEAVLALQANPTDQSKMDACANAWFSARQPWESSEAFLFGPVDVLSKDPNMDSWPLQVDQIQQIISYGNFAEIEGDEEASQNIKGFHTLEYLIFNEGNVRQVTSPEVSQANWIGYMVAVANLLAKDAEELYKVWFEENTTGEFGNMIYKTYFIENYNNPIAQILEGCSDIANEVGESKIGGPYNMYDEDPDQAVLEVESWYSWHSRDDYKNNIRSILYSYMGQGYPEAEVTEAAENSVSNLVKSKLGAERNEQILAAINGAIKAIDNIQPPFRNHIHTSQVATAMEKCSDLQNELDKLVAELGLN